MDNTVGSLTQLQKSVIIGTVLGDGYLRKIKGRKDAFLEINHSIKQKDYVDWKYSVLYNLSGGKPKERKCNEGRVAYRFYTKQLPELTELQQIFYPKGQKIVPDIKIDSMILAVWFMDDGSKCRDSDVYLNTQQFDIECQKRMLSMLKSLGLEARLNKDKHYKRIRFMKSSLPKLKSLLQEHMIPSMRYKIEL